jgi:polar amino acid transport system substrate-binding protein
LRASAEPLEDEPELKAALNTALEKIKADGTYAEIVHKWFGAGAQ